MGTLLLKKIPFWVSFIAVGTIIYDLGFDQSEWAGDMLSVIYGSNFALACIGLVIHYFNKETRPKPKVWLFDFNISFAFFALRVTLGYPIPFFPHPNTWIYLTTIFVFIREFSALKINLNREYLNPAQLFVASFLAIIIAGMLMLFQAEFKKHLSVTYSRNIDSYRNERVAVVGEREEPRGDRTVQTRIVRGDGGSADIEVDYRLRQSDGTWRIIDVIVEGVSLVANFHLQFQDIVGEDWPRVAGSTQESARLATMPETESGLWFRVRVEPSP